jgi:hypothetical protein
MVCLIWLCCCQNDVQSCTALYAAAGNNAEAAMDYLLSLNADVNKLCLVSMQIWLNSFACIYVVHTY